MLKLRVFFLFVIMISTAFAREALVDTKLSTAELKNQVDGYVQQLAEGEKSPLLRKKDFYSLVYNITSYDIESIEAKNGKYLAKIIFHTHKRVYQNDSCPIVSYVKDIQEDITEEIEFKKMQNKLKITKLLSSPYVFEAKSARYILQSEELCK